MNCNYLNIIVSFCIVVYSLNLFSQDSTSILKLQKIEIDLQNQIKVLNDSLAKIQSEIKHIENVEYLKQFESPTGISIEGVCQIKGKIRKEAKANSEIIATVRKGKVVTLTGYERNYWLVKKDNHYGYINEVYIKSTDKVERFKEELKRISNQDKYYKPAYTPNNNQGKTWVKGHYRKK